MKHLLDLFLVLISIESFGQVICPSDTFDLYNDRDTINLRVNGIKQGRWINYDIIISCNDCIDCKSTYAITDFKIKSIGYYIDNKKVGTWTYYHNDTLISRLAKYNDDILDSIDTSFDMKGHLLSRLYWHSGFLDSSIVYYDSLKLKFQGYYYHNKLSDFVIYYPNGQIKYKASQISGLKASVLEFYNEKGESQVPRDYDISSIGLIEDLIKYINY
jgi:antitoxin component YwqK of YwqJK toxin-antitoxin module